MADVGALDRKRSARTAREDRPRRALRIAGWAGIAGPVLFTLAFLLLERLTRDEFDPVRLPVSALEAGRLGWAQQVSFAVFGLLTMVFAVGIHRGLRNARLGFGGPILFGVSGVAALAAGAFPLRLDAAGQVYDPGGHSIAGFAFFLTSALALVFVSRRIAADPAWSGLPGWTLAAGIACLVGFVVMGTLAIPDGAPLHDWAGLGQRTVVLLALFPARVALSIRLLKVVRSGDVD
jgi:hypothetical membrane protein